MQEDSNYYIWNKGDVYFFDKNQYFKTSEFACQCKNADCKIQKINKDIVSKLIELRKEINEPLIITSGFRCKKHQDALRNQGVNTVVAKTTSTHELGDAVDLSPVRMRIKDFLVFCSKKFYAIGIASNFLHLDLRGQKDKKERRWDY